MDYQPKTERRKKSDKAKEKYEKNGKYNQKAVRMMKEARAKEPSTKEPSTKGSK